MAGGDFRLGYTIEDAEDRVFTQMQREQYDRTSGHDALLRVTNADWADAWQNWWDEGDD